jgi:acetyl-CoA synthetase
MADENPLSQIDALLKEDREFPPSAAFVAAAHVSDASIYEQADKDPEAF